LRYLRVGGVRISHQNCVGRYGHVTAKYMQTLNDAMLIPGV
jgi:hypothetical protein